MGKGKRVNLHLALALPTSDQDMVDAPSVVIVGMSCGEELSVKETAWYRPPSIWGRTAVVRGDSSRGHMTGSWPHSGARRDLRFCFCFLAMLCSLWDFSSQTRARIQATALKAQSPNHWTTKELSFFFDLATRLLESQFLNQGWNPCSLQWKLRVLITGLPGTLF